MKTYQPKAKIFSISDKNEGFITVTWPGLSKTVRSDDPQWENSVNAFKSENWEALYYAMNPIETLNKLSYGNITYTDGALYYKDRVVNHSLYERVRQNLKNGFSVTSMLAFLDNLYQNPSFNSISQLYAFLEQRNIPITDDGCFLAYKAVRSDYYDKYSGTILNTVGKIVEMDRSQIDDNPSAYCSYGLHVGGLDYVKWYGNLSDDRVMIVKVNPKDAVSVPSDHSFQKLRVCRYEVVDEYTAPLEGNVYKASLNSVTDMSGSVCDEDSWCGGSCTCYDADDSDMFDFDDLDYDFYHDFQNNSGWVLRVKYDSESKTLILEHDEHNTGALEYYGHLNVPKRVVESFVSAYRPGEYYHRYIMNKYEKFDVGNVDDSTNENENDELETYDFSSVSSWISHAIYNHYTQELEVVLKNGTSYLHEYVIDAEWDDFKNADSPGTFYNEVLKA